MFKIKLGFGSNSILLSLRVQYFVKTLCCFFLTNTAHVVFFKKLTDAFKGPVGNVSIIVTFEIL